MRRDEASIVDILGAAKLIAVYISSETKKSFSSNDVLKAAIERWLTKIGEAAKNLSDDFRRSHPKIPWKQVIGLKNIVTHTYWEVDVDQIWDIANKDVPALAKYLKKIELD